MIKFKISEDTKLWLLIFTIIVIGGVTMAVVYWLIMRFKWWVLFLICIYLVFYKTIEWIARRMPGKIMETCKKIGYLPIVFLYIIYELVQPFITIIGLYFFIVLFAFGIPSLVTTCIKLMGWIVLKPETIVFVVLSLGSVLSSTYTVTKWIIRHSPLKNWGDHEYEFHREQLALYLAHPSNMVFLNYLAYFMILTVSGYMLIQNNSYMVSECVDMAIIKAFLVYIAFTNMRMKAKETEVDVHVLLQQISKLFGQDKF